MACISIIVPIFKVEAYLEKCIDSILCQTFQDFDLILVDDGSPDRCGEICDAYALKDPRVTVIHLENSGVSAARNAGIDWAMTHSESQWLHFVDSDDWVHPQILEKLLKANQELGTQISICDFRSTSDREAELIVTDMPATLILPDQYFLTYKDVANVVWGKLFNKELFQDMRFPVNKVGEDMYVTPFLMFNQEHVSMIPESYYAYYTSPNSITRSDWSPKRMEAVEGYEIILKLFYQVGSRELLEDTLTMYMHILVRGMTQLLRRDKWRMYKQFFPILWKKFRKTVCYCTKERISLNPFFQEYIPVIKAKLMKPFRR